MLTGKNLNCYRSKVSSLPFLSITMSNLAFLTLLFSAAITATTTTAADSYTNHTVGDAAGWFFNPTSNSSAADYSKWAANQTFNLGDYLIFNTNSNQSVIQTYNLTTYRNCTIDEALDTDTLVYSGGDEVRNALTFVVPLTIQGPNYFFSDGEDGMQCQQGMAFEINVKHGLGLPPNLNQPPPPPYVEPPTESDSGLSPPGSVGVNQVGNRGVRSRAGGNVGIRVIAIVVIRVLLLL